MTVKVGISGLRGSVDQSGDELAASSIVMWAQAFVGYLGLPDGRRPRLVLGHDARRSSPALAALVRGALLTSGADLVELGLTITPTVQFATRSDRSVDGGVMVTASHNPLEWNGLKFVDAEGLFLPLNAWQAMEGLIGLGNLPQVPLETIGGTVKRGRQWWNRHERAVLDSVDVERIRQCRYRVVLDACNGGAARWAATFRKLGCEVVVLHGEQHGYFERGPEPVPQNLAVLRDMVVASGSDIGFAADPDGDRLVLVDGHGKGVSEEQTVVLAAQAVAGPGDRVVANVVTTHALEDALPGVEVIRTAVGEFNVVSAVRATGAVLGGEGSGGVIVPKVNMARDGVVAGALILSLMADRGLSLSALVAALPHWHSVKATMPAPPNGAQQLSALARRWRDGPPAPHTDGPNALTISDDTTRLRLAWDEEAIELSLHQEGGELRVEAGAPSMAAMLPRLHADVESLRVDVTDGIKITSDRVWISLRASNTEPIFRLMGESRQD